MTIQDASKIEAKIQGIILDALLGLPAAQVEVRNTRGPVAPFTTDRGAIERGLAESRARLSRPAVSEFADDGQEEMDLPGGELRRSRYFRMARQIAPQGEPEEYTYLIVLYESRLCPGDPLCSYVSVEHGRGAGFIADYSLDLRGHLAAALKLSKVVK